MIRRNKWKLLISSLVILLPIVFGLILWDQLPEELTTHWGVDGTADGWSSRLVAIVVLPVIILLLHWICIFFTVKDPKNKDQNQKVFGLVLWICPVISLFACSTVYATALGKDFPIDSIVLSLIGLLLVIMGNYLPKCKQNYTIGIKIKWTLANEENWNATHRMAGRLWVVGGLLIMIGTFLPRSILPWLLVSSFMILAAAPMIYSYVYHKKQVKEGTSSNTPTPKSKETKIATMISLVVTAVILLFVLGMMFVGSIDVICGEDSFTVKASYWNDLTVDYDAIDSIEYRDSDSVGSRTGGLGSAKLLAGAFRNEEFGHYTRYSYTQCDACVVLTMDGKVLVINGHDADSTKDIYEQIKSNMN